jgi:glyoxylase-like metal-dependent hydrolase (beta-lactamase superfamily II)
MLRHLAITGLKASLLLALFTLPSRASEQPPVEHLGGGLTVVRGAVNGVLIERGGKRLAVYGDPRDRPAAVDTVLFTHHRRDVVWAGRPLVASGARAVVPEAEIAEFSGVQAFWSAFQRARFHDYAQRTTKVLAEPMAVAQPVRGGQTITWEGLPIRVLDTPGYTRGSVTYSVELDGRRVAFTGDLIYGDGKLLDLYSLQDAIPEARIDAYHGYAARLGDLLASLRKVRAERPDVLIPARGPVIKNPDAAIDTLIHRIQAVYANYLSIDAHHYYSMERPFLIKARRVLGADAQVECMPEAEKRNELPAWIVPIDNARLILSSDRTGFLVDCGSQHIIDTLKGFQTSGRLTSIDHVFITHYHDDHTDQVASLVKTFGATVHASLENRDVLEHPGAYRLPCLTANPVHVSGRAASGSRWKWKEFEMTLFYFPGQTLHHDALLVRKAGDEPVLFIGDSFTPSGIDDYCIPNRNFLHEGMGFLYCLDLIKRVAPTAWLVNQHVSPAFRFSGDQIDRMKRTLEQRVELLRSLLPWDDPNFGLDEGWARFYPYTHAVHPGQTIRCSLRIMNHSPVEQCFFVGLHLPEGWTLRSMTPAPIRILAREEGAVELTISVPAPAPAGTHILTADLRWGDRELREWTESIVTVTRDEPTANSH